VAGVWLGIGTSPAALVLGASLAERHQGALPWPVIAVGAVVALALLLGQGRIGLAPPHGDGGTLAQVLPEYLTRPQRTLVGWLLVAAMAGWLAFNAGLGGAALAALTGTAPAIGVAAFGLPLLLLALSGMSRWNAVAVIATASALVLVVQVAVVAVRHPSAQVPLTSDLGPPLLALADIGALVGYVAVFSVRGPDFTARMRGRADLVVCVALLMVPLLLVTTAGALLWWTTGTTDLVVELERSPAGTALVAVAMVAPALTAFFSGGLALESVTPWSFRVGVLVVAVPGLLLGAIGLHQRMLGLLVVLGAALPSLVVPMAVEARARRRGAEPRIVPAWTWLPASMVAVLLTAIGVAWTPVLGLALAAAATVTWRQLGRAR
jgi:hypothetical protein